MEEEKELGGLGKRLVIESTAELLKDAKEEKERLLSSTPALALKLLAQEAWALGKNEEAMAFGRVALLHDGNIFDGEKIRDQLFRDDYTFVVEPKDSDGKDKSELQLSKEYKSKAISAIKSSKYILALGLMEEALSLNLEIKHKNEDLGMPSKLDMLFIYPSDDANTKVVENFVKSLDVEYVTFSSKNGTWAMLNLLDGLRLLPKIKAHQQIKVCKRTDFPLQHIYSCLGYLHSIRWMMKYSSVSFSKDPYHFTPLDYAKNHGHQQIVRELWIYADKRYYDFPKKQYLTLFEGASIGNVALIKYALEKGVDINTKDPDGATAMIHASANGQLVAVKFLIEHGATGRHLPSGECMPPFAYASKHGHLAIVKYFVELDLSQEEQQMDYYQVGYDSYLGRACEESHLEIAKYLVEHGANVNAESDHFKETILVLAAYKGDLAYVKHLFNNYKLDFSKGSGNRLALEKASYDRHFDVVRYLLEECPQIEFSVAEVERALSHLYNLYDDVDDDAEMIEYLTTIKEDIKQKTKQKERDQESAKHLPKHSAVGQGGNGENNNSNEQVKDSQENGTGRESDALKH